MRRHDAGWGRGEKKEAGAADAGEAEEHLALAVDVGRHDTQNMGEGICFKNEGHVETGRCGVSCN